MGVLESGAAVVAGAACFGFLCSLAVLDPAARRLEGRLERIAGAPRARPSESAAVGRGRRGAGRLPRGWVVVLAAALVAVGWATGHGPPLPAAVLAAAAGVGTPHFAAQRRRAVRRARLARDLPGAVELLALAAEAGLGLAQAVRVVSGDLPGPLGGELRQVAREMAVGRPLGPSLRDMAGRVEALSISAFVATVVQGESLGTPIARLLHEQARAARVRCRQEAEAAMGALPLRMTLVAMVFFFPVLFILVVLPNLFTFFRT